MNACCGHGQENLAYVQFNDGEAVYREDALRFMSILREEN